MPSFSQRSLQRLWTCHLRLIDLFLEVVQHHDCTVLQGWRSQEEQEEAVRTGHSRLHWPESLHNHTAPDGRPQALAVDVAPYPVDWNNLERFRAFGGFVLGLAAARGIPIRWGGDWDGDWQFNDQTLVDLPHFELREER